MTSSPADPRGPELLPSVVIVALGGALGGVLRYLATSSTGDAVLATTMSVNVLGSFLLALVPALARVRRYEAWRLFTGPGILGGFTTLSAINEQTRSLLAQGRVLLGAIYMLGTLVACVGAVALAARLVTTPTSAAKSRT